jgi:MFS transporter, FSR family, fosmidomycin resistance protein
MIEQRGEVISLNKRVIGFLAISHFFNDVLVGVIGAIIPLLTVHFHLSYFQVGVLIMTSNVSSALIQPFFGWFSDKKGSAWSLPLSALLLGLGLVSITLAPSFVWILPAVVVNGIGSAIFHPDASRAVYFAAGNQRGLAQSVFQIGGNSGLAVSALVLWFLGHVGLSGAKWMMIPAVLSAILLSTVVRWFAAQLLLHRDPKQPRRSVEGSASRFGLSLLTAIVTIRSWITTGILTFIPLYVMKAYGVTAQHTWPYMFVFLLLGAIGTMIGGPLADRFGQRAVIRLSMVVSTPFAILLPYLPKAWLLPDLGVLGFCLLSTFAVTVVYGQEMLPNNIAMVSGLLIGFAGGVGGLGIMAMGKMAESYGLKPVLDGVVYFLPLAALCTIWLPLDRIQQMRHASEPVQAAIAP